MSERPFVSIVVPSRNSSETVRRCFEAIVNQDYPHDRLEVVVGDGSSTDGTVEMIERILAGTDIRLQSVETTGGATPQNLNAALACASGDLICRIDTRSVIPPHYVRVCAEILTTRPEVAVVGGAVLTLTQSDHFVDVGVVRALNNRFAMGGAPYRSGGRSGPTDTAYLGAFRTDELRDAGGWDEAMVINQDYELNRRMGRRGIVWFDDSLVVGYLSRRRVGDVFRQYVKFGRWKVKYWRYTGDRPQRRQIIRILLPPAVLAAALSFVAAGRSTWRLWVLGAAGVGGSFAIEHAGTPRGQAGFRARVVAVVTLTAVAIGWFWGVVAEFARGWSPAPATHGASQAPEKE